MHTWIFAGGHRTDYRMHGHDGHFAWITERGSQVCTARAMIRRPAGKRAASALQLTQKLMVDPPVGGGRGGQRCTPSRLSLLSRNLPPSMSFMSATHEGASDPIEPSAQFTSSREAGGNHWQIHDVKPWGEQTRHTSRPFSKEPFLHRLYVR